MDFKAYNGTAISYHKGKKMELIFFNKSFGFYKLY